MAAQMAAKSATRRAVWALTGRRRRPDNPFATQSVYRECQLLTTGLQMSLQVLSSVQHNEQMGAWWKGQYAESASANSLSHTPHRTSRFECREKCESRAM